MLETDSALRGACISTNMRLPVYLAYVTKGSAQTCGLVEMDVAEGYRKTWQMRVVEVVTEHARRYKVYDICV